MSLFDPDLAIEARDLAVDVVEENADDEWFATALGIVRELAAFREPFTTDEIWFVLEARRGLVTPEPRAMGAVMRSAAANGWVRATDAYRKSVRVECHARPLRVWIGR